MEAGRERRVWVTGELARPCAPSPGRSPPGSLARPRRPLPWAGERPTVAAWSAGAGV